MKLGILPCISLDPVSGLHDLLVHCGPVRHFGACDRSASSPLGRFAQSCLGVVINATEAKHKASSVTMLMVSWLCASSVAGSNLTHGKQHGGKPHAEGSAAAQHDESAGMQARSVYREVLRVLSKHVKGSAESNQWHAYVATSFRQPITDVDDADAKLQIAKDYCFMTNNIAHHRNLLKTYNIGLEDDERTKQMVEAVAKRVGLALPTKGGHSHHHQRQKHHARH